MKCVGIIWVSWERHHSQTERVWVQNPAQIKLFVLCNLCWNYLAEVRETPLTHQEGVGSNPSPNNFLILFYVIVLSVFQPATVGEARSN